MYKDDKLKLEDIKRLNTTYHSSLAQQLQPRKKRNIS